MPSVSPFPDDSAEQIQLGGETPTNPQEMPPTTPETPNNDNPFGKEKFDAGVGVDEDADPKTYIQKLTGKLAQKLRDYSETEKDTDLSKFVINSLIPAAIPQMDETDANDVIDKVKDNIGKNDNQPQQDNIEVPQQDNTEMPQEEPIQQEAKEPEIDELINEILNRKKLSRNINNKKPFQAPKFK